jgi:putative flippase GtrA
MWLALSFQFVPALATTVGFTAGASARFLFSYLHVFEPGGNMIQTIPHFVFALFLQMLVNAGVLSLFLSTSFPVWPSQVLTTGMLIIFNFLAHKFWGFR